MQLPNVYMATRYYLVFRVSSVHLPYQSDSVSSHISHRLYTIALDDLHYYGQATGYELASCRHVLETLSPIFEVQFQLILRILNCVFNLGL